jgi:peptidyl-tRNA hydrolase, PTH1 family
VKAEPPSSLGPLLIVGLGNPGDRYRHTRHNLGFMVIDALAQRWQMPLQTHKRFQGEFAEGRFGREPVQLLKPTTFMNNSGQSVRAVLDWYKRPPQAVFVIYDDLDLPLGKLRIRLNGSAGGHNGIRSLIAHLQTQTFPRLRLGINPAQNVGQAKDTIAHVLGSFAPFELPLVTATIDLAVEAVETSLQHGMETAMNRYNARTATPV